MTTTYLARREWTKRIPQRTAYDPNKIVVTGALTHIKGNASPYFSLTCALYRNGRDEGGGAAHEKILAAFPELAPIALVHLSDDHGVPMHAIGNGLYWLGLTKWEAYKRDVLMRHLRVSAAEADAIHEYVGARDVGNPSEALRYMFTLLDLPARWKAQAAEALAIIQGS